MPKSRFEFLNTTAHLSLVLKRILEYVNSFLPDNASCNEAVFKSKVIITELLTNSLKHSGSSNTLIDININKKRLVISKIDYGNPLSLIHHDNPACKKIPVTTDILHTLYAVKRTNNVLYFFCEGNMDDILAIDNIVEHFGLLIITKAADKFTYSYDRRTNANIFIATIKFN